MSAIKHVVGSDGLKAACEEGKPIVVKFHATWCGSCKKIAPKFEELAEENKNAGIQFVDMDYDEDEPFIAGILKVDLLPTFIAFKGPKMLEKSPGSDLDGINKVIAAAKAAAANGGDAAAKEQEAPAQPAAETEEPKKSTEDEAPKEPAFSSPFVKHVVGSDGLKDACEEGKPVMVKFYASWCGSCKKIAPRFGEIAEQEKESGVQFVEMDYDEDEPFIAGILKVELLPSFIAFQKGKMLERSAGSGEEGIQKVLAAAKAAV
jgi:thiol-disulfide isomerase/thioredoxin